MWRVTELLIAVFDLSEVMEKVLYVGHPVFFRLVSFYRVIDGPFMVLNLGVPDRCGQGVVGLVCPSQLMLFRGWRGLGACWR